MSKVSDYTLSAASTPLYKKMGKVHDFILLAASPLFTQKWVAWLTLTCTFGTVCATPPTAARRQRRRPRTRTSGGSWRAPSPPGR